MDKTSPVDAAQEIAQAARVALDALVIRQGRRDEFAGMFCDAAGHNMARPERVEDVPLFTERAVDLLLEDPQLRDTLVCLVRGGLTKYMEPR